jgi:hypothetical protein
LSSLPDSYEIDFRLTWTVAKCSVGNFAGIDPLAILRRIHIDVATVTTSVSEIVRRIVKSHMLHLVFTNICCLQTQQAVQVENFNTNWNSISEPQVFWDFPKTLPQKLQAAEVN